MFSRPARGWAARCAYDFVDSAHEVGTVATTKRGVADSTKSSAVDWGAEPDRACRISCRFLPIFVDKDLEGVSGLETSHAKFQA